ncbi:MAG: hypothetical protein WAV78_47195 [Xanthobacteraceae bacterium]
MIATLAAESTYRQLWATVGAGTHEPSGGRLNIELYREVLIQEMDEAKRQTILLLLADEETKLASLNNSFQRKRRRS